MIAIRWTLKTGKRTTRHLQRKDDLQTLCAKTPKSNGQEIVAVDEMTHDEWQNCCWVCRRTMAEFDRRAGK